MHAQIQYGQESSIHVKIASDCLVSNTGTPAGFDVRSPRAATTAALAEPLGYPPFAETVMPGDRVVLAVDQELPAASTIVGTILEMLLAAGVHARDVTVLLPPEGIDAKETRFERMRSGMPSEFKWLVHDPADSAQLAYLAASRDAKPIYFNRALCDADVVVPIGALRAADAPGYFGVHGCLYPTLSDTQAIGRFRAPASTVHAPQHARRRAEVAEAAWLLGVQFTVQAVPGRGDSTLAVLAGQAAQVVESAQRQCAAAWTYEVPRKAELVVAMVPGGPDRHNWETFARALFAASRVCDDRGSILICTELTRGPGRALAHLARPESDELVNRRVFRERSPDALTASLLLDIRARQHVFLLSHLAQDVVEGLGLGYVADAAQVQQRIERSRSCIVLTDAQHVMPRVSRADAVRG